MSLPAGPMDPLIQRREHGLRAERRRELLCLPPLPTDKAEPALAPDLFPALLLGFSPEPCHFVHVLRWSWDKQAR